MNKLTQLITRTVSHFQIPEHVSRFDLWIYEGGQICHEKSEYLQDALKIAQSYYEISKYHGFKTRIKYYETVIRIIQNELAFRMELYMMDRSLYRRIYGK